MHAQAKHLGACSPHQTFTLTTTPTVHLTTPGTRLHFANLQTTFGAPKSPLDNVVIPLLPPKWYPSTPSSSLLDQLLTPPQTALFNFQSLLLVILLTICTATYAHYVFPGIIDRNKENYFVSPIWKAARVGERLSPYVSLACVVMAVSPGSLCLEWTMSRSRDQKCDRGYLVHRRK